MNFEELIADTSSNWKDCKDFLSFEVGCTSECVVGSRKNSYLVLYSLDRESEKKMVGKC